MAQTRQEQLLAVGVFMTANLRGESYARYALVTAPGTLPGGLYGAWLGWTYAPILAILAIFLPLYFPTGRLLSRRWRPVVWFGIGFLAFAVVGNALWPGPQPPLPGLEPAPNLVVFLPQAKPLFELFRTLAGLCLLPGIAGAIAALVVRFRRARGIERQQLKWFAYAAALAPVPGFAYELAPSIFGLLRALMVRWCRSVSASRSCAIGCTRSTGSSTAPWSTGCSPSPWACAMRLDRWCRPDHPGVSTRLRDQIDSTRRGSRGRRPGDLLVVGSAVAQAAVRDPDQ